MFTRKKLKRLCTLPGCRAKHYIDGLCRMHHARWERNGESFDKGPKTSIGGQKKVRGKCQVDKCDKPHYALGMCNVHYQYKRYLDIVTDPDTPKCEVDGCDLRHVARGMCMAHYKAWYMLTKAQDMGL